MPIVTSTGLQPGKCHYCYRNGNVNQSFNQSRPQKALASLGRAGLQKWYDKNSGKQLKEKKQAMLELLSRGVCASCSVLAVGLFVINPNQWYQLITVLLLTSLPAYYRHCLTTGTPGQPPPQPEYKDVPVS